MFLSLKTTIRSDGNLQIDSKDQLDIKSKDDIIVVNYIAAYSQGEIQTNFSIFRLSLAWIIENDLVTAEMTSIESNIEQSWITLNNFANSVQLNQV
jgi:hypothetical protein